MIYVFDFKHDIELCFFFVCESKFLIIMFFLLEQKIEIIDDDEDDDDVDGDIMTSNMEQMHSLLEFKVRPDSVKEKE